MRKLIALATAMGIIAAAMVPTSVEAKTKARPKGNPVGSFAALTTNPNPAGPGRGKGSRMFARNDNSREACRWRGVTGRNSTGQKYSPEQAAAYCP